MHETCDLCGRQFEVLAVVFTGRQCLCFECYEARQAAAMGAHAVRH